MIQQSIPLLRIGILQRFYEFPTIKLGPYWIGPNTIKIRRPSLPKVLIEVGCDIGIPNEPAEDSTRGLLKAHDSNNKKIRKPKLILRKVRIVLEMMFVILRDEL
jgi:hypothetical protein